MEKDTLSQVIEAEKEIQKRIEIEKAKAADWLEGAKKAAEADYLREEKKIRTSIERRQAEAAKEIEEQAARIVEGAAREAERFGSLEADCLERIVRKQITRILPG
jgi:hypothetical protein